MKGAVAVMFVAGVDTVNFKILNETIFAYFVLVLGNIVNLFPCNGPPSRMSSTSARRN
jgi:hypothetical protein